MSRLCLLLRDRRGASSVEFALWTSLIFVVLLMSADFANYAIQQAKLARSVSEASMQAFNTKDAIDTGQLTTMVTSSSNLPGTPPIVTISCNGAACANTGRTCACLGSDGVVGAALACTATCPTGALPGYYLTIKASYSYAQPILSGSPITGKGMTQTSTVRLQ